jgi:hypothetical protein
VRKSVLPSHVEFAVIDSSISNHHNIFEKHHRFIGWMGLAVCTPHSDFDDSADRNQTTWAFVILGNSYDITLGQWRHKTNSLLSAQELWFAVFMTVLLAFLQLTGDSTYALQCSYPLVDNSRGHRRS